MTSVSRYDVNMPLEDDCVIEGCCLLPNDEILLLDSNNWSLKRLDASYCVTSTCKPRGRGIMVSSTNMTYIGNSEAVVCDLNSLVYVNVSGNMSVNKTVALDTACIDVTCRNDSLYVLYDTSIHICTLEGNTVSVLPVLPLEQTGVRNRRIAVTDDGRMYVTTYENGLLILDSSGNVINTLSDVASGPVCVDDRGNVWVDGYDNKVYQIIADDSQILNTLSVNTVGDIWSLCYDTHRSSLIIGGKNTLTVIGLN